VVVSGLTATPSGVLVLQLLDLHHVPHLVGAEIEIVRFLRVSLDLLDQDLLVGIPQFDAAGAANDLSHWCSPDANGADEINDR
jgi:hypothetical protein